MSPSVPTTHESDGDKPALDDIDRRLPAGMIFALLGPNGVGSTWRRPWSAPPPGD